MNIADSAVTGFSSRRFKGDNITGLVPDNPPLAPLTTYEEVSEGHCRWPIEIEGRDLCCGREALGTGPYCATHALRAYTKPHLQTPSSEESYHIGGLNRLRKCAAALAVLNGLHLAEDLGL